MVVTLLTPPFFSTLLPSISITPHTPPPRRSSLIMVSPPPYSSRHHRIRKCVKVHYSDTEAEAETSSEAETIMCEACNGNGWLVCDFCEGQKTNVKALNNNRIYRRCPSCKAVGYVLCSKCKVFKCVTFPDFNDSTNSISD